MDIHTLVQGEDDQKLFGLIGHWLVDKRVHEEIGIAVTSAVGDYWLIALDSKDAVAGFLNARLMSNGGMHIRITYSIKGGDRTQGNLIKHAVMLAVENHCPVIWANEKKTSSLLPKHDFIAKPRARGVFCRWERTLEESEK